VLAGRQEILDDFEDTFSGASSAAGLTVLLSGQHGMGKTVMLDAYERTTRDDGWLTISESSSPGLLDHLWKDHLPPLLQQESGKLLKKIASANLPAGAGGVSFTDRYPAESTLRSEIDELTDWLDPNGRGLAITVDEVQAADLEELRKLGEFAQFARREERPLAFGFSGLSTPVEELLDQPGTTFLRRAEHYRIGPLMPADGL